MADFFDEYARFYDSDYDFDDDLLMIRQYAARCGSPILELGCGTGRLLVPLAHEGYQLSGVDLSAAMLDLARAKLSAEGLDGNVDLVEQDMRTLELGGHFNLAFAAINTFAHITTAGEQVAALRRFHQHLNPGGLLLLDLFNPDPGRLLDARGQLVLDKVLTEPATGQTLMKFRAQTVDLAQQIIHTTLMVDRLDEQGQVQRSLFSFALRYLFRGELELMLHHTGFEIEVVYGSYELDEFSDDSDKMIAVARRVD